MAQPGRKKNEDSPYSEQAQRLAAGLRSRREQADLTQEQLAAQARVAVATVRKIEGGRVVNPGIFTVMAMLKVLGAQPEDVAALVVAPSPELPSVTTGRARPRPTWDQSWDEEPAEPGDLRDIRDTARDESPGSSLGQNQQRTFNPLVHGSSSLRATHSIPVLGA